MSLNDTKLRVCPHYGNHCLCGNGPCGQISQNANWGSWKIDRWPGHLTRKIDDNRKESD